MGSVAGFLLRADGEPTIYWAGDTVWCDAVRRVIVEADPDIIITHSSGASFEPGKPIIMDGKQTILAEADGIGANRLLIPADGETLIV
jgi:hypothetical protein